MRDLVRMRALAMKDQRKARQQLHSFLLRHGRSYPGKHWTKAHRRWLGELTFGQPAQHLVLEELLGRIERAEELCERLKKAIVDLVPQWTLAPVVAAVQALRGVSILVAATVVAEVGNFNRFESPRQLMAYLGLNPSEHSSGATIRRGPITKTGNSLARTCLVEAAWTYRHPARVTQIIRERLKGLPEPIRARPALSHYMSSRSEIDAGAKSLFDAVAQGVVASNVVKTFPLRQAAAAHKFIGGRKTTGSIVMLPFE
jgi:transposase